MWVIFLICELMQGFPQTQTKGCLTRPSTASSSEFMYHVNTHTDNIICCLHSIWLLPKTTGFPASL